MKKVAIVQARMGSTRLPGKVMKNLGGEPVLARVVNRVARSATVDAVVIATTSLPEDDVIVDMCRGKGWNHFRGSEEDVLDRYYQAALAFSADVVVRVTSDCPLVEPGLIDEVVRKLLLEEPKLDYVSNCLERTYPRGLDVEAFRFEALARAWQEDNDPLLREHVTQYIVRHPEKFALAGVTSDFDYSYMRWTVDTMEDLNLVRKVYDHFGNDTFCWKEVLVLLAEHPEWMEINRHIEQKKVSS